MTGHDGHSRERYDSPFSQQRVGRNSGPADSCLAGFLINVLQLKANLAIFNFLLGVLFDLARERPSPY